MQTQGIVPVIAPILVTFYFVTTGLLWAHPRQAHVYGNGWFQRVAERTRPTVLSVRQID